VSIVLIDICNRVVASQLFVDFGEWDGSSVDRDQERVCWGHWGE